MHYPTSFKSRALFVAGFQLLNKLRIMSFYKRPEFMIVVFIIGIIKMPWRSRALFKFGVIRSAPALKVQDFTNSREKQLVANERLKVMISYPINFLMRRQSI